MTTFKANRKFPNPITVTDDPKSHTLALQQVIEALNIGQRRTKEVQSSYVRVHELVDIGLIEVVGNQLKLTNVGQAAVSGGATTLAALTDVDLTGLADGDVLVYDSGTATWVPGTASGASALADLTDVDLTGLVNGDTLVWNSGTSMWEPGTGGGGGLSDLYDQTLNNLADVGFYQPREGDVLTYSSSLGLWVSESPGALSGVTYSEQASNFNALSNHAYLITADNVVATLPASPSDGDFVILTSGGYVANCSVGRNGNNIMGFAEDLDLDGAVFTVRLVYMASTTNWVISL